MTDFIPGREGKYYASERNDIIDLIPSGVRRVLDVGCGYGNMGKKLRAQRNAEVVGIEKEKAVLDVAKRNVDKLIIGDVEDTRLTFEKGYNFDCIVYGSILEHLKDPWKVLKEHSYFLKKGGYCLACLPNICHYSIIKELMKNRWEYKPEGILDESHLRFFTLSGIVKMFSDAGYTIEKEKRYVRASKSKKILNKILFGRIEYLLTEQYIVRGRLDQVHGS